MITIRREEEADVYELIIDGRVFTKDQASVHPHRNFKSEDIYEFSIRANSQEARDILSGQTFADIPPDIWSVDLDVYVESSNSSEVNDAAISVDTRITQTSDRSRRELNFYCRFDADVWKGAWSIGEYVSKFVETFKAEGPEAASLGMDDEESPSDGFVVSFPIIDRGALIGDKITECERALEEIFDLTESALDEELAKDSVVVHFDFPPEIKVACEQYLLYFVQFLEDVGVEATAELHHEAGEVLFAITPAEKDEALDKIRAALDTYLRLAASPVNSASVLITEIEVQRLSANIQHLQGQLTLAHAVLQAKDATIQLQQTTIAQQRQMLTGEIVFESMKDVTPKPKDAEEVLGGLAEITKYEGKGFNLNLPEAFRRLRKLFGEKKGGQL